MHKVSAIVPPKQILHSVVEYMKNTRNALRGEWLEKKYSQPTFHRRTKVEKNIGASGY